MKFGDVKVDGIKGMIVVDCASGKLWGLKRKSELLIGIHITSQERARLYRAQRSWVFEFVITRP
jgi:hypothetical protein